MKPFNIKLTDEDRAALERVRIRMGLRSHAETLRALISKADGAGEAEPVGAEPIAARRTRLVTAVNDPKPVTAWKGGHPKPGKR